MKTVVTFLRFPLSCSMITCSIISRSLQPCTAFRQPFSSSAIIWFSSRWLLTFLVMHPVSNRQVIGRKLPGSVVFSVLVSWSCMGIKDIDTDGWPAVMTTDYIEIFSISKVRCSVVLCRRTVLLWEMSASKECKINNFRKNSNYHSVSSFFAGRPKRITDILE